MSAAPQAKCVTCSQTAPLRPDGRFKRHPKHPTARERCASSGGYPVCPCCGRAGTEPTVSPNTRLCRDCARAIMSGKLPMKCDAKGCRAGYTRCEDHRVRGERVCHECGKEGPAPEIACMDCDGTGVVYVDRDGGAT